MHIAIYGYSYLRTVKDERKRYNLAKTAKKLKIIPLGGVGEIGKNMTVIEYWTAECHSRMRRCQE